MWQFEIAYSIFHLYYINLLRKIKNFYWKMWKVKRIRWRLKKSGSR